MTSVILIGFLVGALAANGVPHFVIGITGQKQKMPMIGQMPPEVSVLWGWLNFVAAVLLWHVAPMRFHPRAAFVAVAVGALIMSLFVACMMKRAGRK